jgi:hypothetical protein
MYMMQVTPIMDVQRLASLFHLQALTQTRTLKVVYEKNILLPLWPCFLLWVALLLQPLWHETLTLSTGAGFEATSPAQAFNYKVNCLAYCQTIPDCNAVSYATDLKCYPQSIPEDMTLTTDSADQSYRTCEPGAHQLTVPCCCLIYVQIQVIIHVYVYRKHRDVTTITDLIHPVLCGPTISFVCPKCVARAKFPNIRLFTLEPYFYVLKSLQGAVDML